LHEARFIGRRILTVDSGRGDHCDAGLVCTDLGDSEMGTCLPAAAGGAGDPCEVGQLHSQLASERDRVSQLRALRCVRGGVCNGNAVGFPSGSCANSCDAVAAGEACGLIPALQPFNACIARGEPFAACVARTARPAAMRARGRDQPCRDDFICARAPAAEGVCLPPYFLFQLRVDGHVL
jgi:hypothetical protein